MLQSFKINVRDYFIKYAKQSNYNVKHKIKIIEDRIDYIENLPSSEINMNEKRELEQKLDSKYDNVSKGAQIRSKSKWISESRRYNARTERYKFIKYCNHNC